VSRGHRTHDERYTAGNNHEEEENMHVFTTGTQKGGPGKTTTTVNLAGALALAGNRVGIVDFDPQGDATYAMGVQPKPGATLGDLVTNKNLLIDEVIVDRSATLQDTGSQGRLLVLPAERTALMGAATEMTKNPIAGAYAFRSILERLAPHLDYAFIDSRPDLDILTGVAASASDDVIAVMCPDLATTRGGLAYKGTVDEIQAAEGGRGRFLGVVLNRFEDKEEAAWVLHVLEEENITVFDTKIPNSRLASKAFVFGRPAVLHWPGSPLAAAYVALATELLTRSNAARSSTGATSG
jgi:chromosome partitioning protein